MLDSQDVPELIQIETGTFIGEVTTLKFSLKTDDLKITNNIFNER